MNHAWLFRRRDRITVVVTLLAVVSTVSNAQAATVIPAGSGIQYRYRGDTLWRERDSTATQSIFRGDTLYRSTFMHGLKRGSEVFVMLGDSARLVEARDASGKDITSTRPAMPSTGLVDNERSSVEGAIRSLAAEASLRAAEERLRETNARAEANGFPTRTLPTTPTVPLSPSTRQTYPFSANRVLEQLGDTVRYINGCTARRPVDTTVYLLFATDSVRRLSPSPRMFGAMMAQAVRGDLGYAFRQRVRPADNPAMQGVPKLNKWPCDLR